MDASARTRVRVSADERLLLQGPAARLLKEAFPEIVPSLTHITKSNRSLEECVRYVCKAYRQQLRRKAGLLVR